jgi:hypothetical protein
MPILAIPLNQATTRWPMDHISDVRYVMAVAGCTD